MHFTRKLLSAAVQCGACSLAMYEIYGTAHHIQQYGMDDFPSATQFLPSMKIGSGFASPVWRHLHLLRRGLQCQFSPIHPFDAAPDFFGDGLVGCGIILGDSRALSVLGLRIAVDDACFHHVPHPYCRPNC